MKKKMAAFIGLSAVLSFLLACTALASNLNWTDTLSAYLNDHLAEAAGGKTDFTNFTLFDIEGDGLPEIFLNSKSGQYQIVRINNYTASLERTFSAKGFYKTYEGDFIVAYGDESSLSYVTYSPERSISSSVLVYRERKVSGTSDIWIYYVNNKEVSKEVYDETIREELINQNMVFLPLTQENIDDYVYAGNWGYGANPVFEGAKLGAVGSSVTFPDGSKASVGGVNSIYGFLMVNGNLISQIYPVNENDRTLIPVRAVGENLNARVGWVANLQKVVVEGANTIEMYIGDTTAYVNGERVELDVPAKIIDDSTYVPVRFVAENLDADVFFWGGDGLFTPIVSIESKQTYNTITEREAMTKAAYFFENVEWMPNQMAFTKAHMAKNVGFQMEGLLAGRFWSIFVDINKTQRVWIDQYTGKLFSVYETRDLYGIEQGVEYVIDALRMEYLY